MKYRELLDKCKRQPGLFASGEQKNQIAQAKYSKWAESLDQEYKKNKIAQNKGRRS